MLRRLNDWPGDGMEDEVSLSGRKEGDEWGERYKGDQSKYYPTQIYMQKEVLNRVGH